MDNKDVLDPKHIKFIDAYFKYQDINTICDKLKISRATYYNYLKLDAVKDAINSQIQDLLIDTTKYLQANLNKASKELINIIDSKDTPPQTKINAINCIFNNTFKLTEQTDIITRLNDIENKLKEQEIASEEV